MLTSFVEFFRAGGFAMWFILGFGASALIAATVFARRPDEVRLGMIRALTTATVFASIGGFAAGIATTCKYCAAHMAGPEPWQAILMAGTAESSSNLILGAGLASLTWLVVAIGLRRLAWRDAHPV